MLDNRHKVFIDSNVIIYAYSNSEKEKQQTARKTLKENYTVISTQVLQEISNTLGRKKYLLDYLSNIHPHIFSIIRCKNTYIF